MQLNETRTLNTHTQPEGCAARTATPVLRVGQQLLQVENTSLCGLRHKETVMAIKGAFEGPMNKTLTFVVLDRGEVRVCILIICVYCVCFHKHA